MEVSVENLCGMLVRGKLLPAEEVKALYQRWKNEAKEARSDAAQFRKWLVTRSFVTPQQASLLGVWLEQGKPTATAEPPARSAPASTTPPGPDPFDFGAVPASPASGKTKETPHSAAPPNRPQAPETVDFSLDTTQPAPKASPPEPAVRAGLSMRDWLMLAIGAVAVIVVALLGMLLARVNS